MKIIGDAQVGIDPAAARKAEQRKAQAAKRTTFAAVAAEFMQDHAKDHRTRDEMQRKLDVELLPHWGDRPIASITRADVKSLIRAKARGGEIAANRLLALVSKIFNWALDEDVIGASPAVRFGYSKEQDRERVLTADEIKILWQAFGKLGYPFVPRLGCCLLLGNVAAKSLQ